MTRFTLPVDKFAFVLQLVFLLMHIQYLTLEKGVMLESVEATGNDIVVTFPQLQKALPLECMLNGVQVLFVYNVTENYFVSCQVSITGTKHAFEYCGDIWPGNECLIVP